VFELEPVNRKSGTAGYCLTDGRVTLAVLPWSIPVFEGMSVKRPGPDHIGFHVENLDAFKARVAEVAGMNPYLAGVPLGGSPESDVRKRFFAVRRAANGRCPIPTGTGSTSPTSDGVHSSATSMWTPSMSVRWKEPSGHFWNSLRRASPSEP